jgi:hypothetical protein
VVAEDMGVVNIPPNIPPNINIPPTSLHPTSLQTKEDMGVVNIPPNKKRHGSCQHPSKQKKTWELSTSLQTKKDMGVVNIPPNPSGTFTPEPGHVAAQLQGCHVSCIPQGTRVLAAM